MNTIAKADGLIDDRVVEKEGKYLTFTLSNEEFGLEILKVKEIIGCIDIVTLPQMPDHIKGIVDLRHKVIPVIDLKTKFGMGSVESTVHTSIIFVETKKGNAEYSTGILVDKVNEVIDIHEKDIEKAPDFGASIDTDFILGIGKVNNSMKILLDINRILLTDRQACNKNSDVEIW